MKVPNAEEYLNKRYKELGINHVDEIDNEDRTVAIELSKLHVNACKEAIITVLKRKGVLNISSENLIRNTYPSKNIK